MTCWSLAALLSSLAWWRFVSLRRRITAPTTGADLVTWSAAPTARGCDAGAVWVGVDFGSEAPVTIWYYNDQLRGAVRWNTST